MRRALALCLLFVATSAGRALAAADGRSGAREDGVRARPDIVLILVDDLGWADLGLHGAEQVETPHIDALATTSVRMEQGYVTAPICAPSRAGLLTGRYPQRFGFELNPEHGLRAGGRPGLPRGERTIGDRLRQQGYRTILLGKWHLGFHREFFPLDRGFDEFFGFLGSTLPYFDPGGHNALFRGREKVAEKTYFTQALAREAVEVISRDQEHPFFLLVSFNAVHLPLQAPEAHLRRIGLVPTKRRRKVLAMTRALDDAVGRITAALERSERHRDTLVVFVNDNGGGEETHSSNWPLRGGKRSTLEGGIRVPFLIRWPQRLEGGRSYPHPVSTLDLLPTFVNAAGGELSEDLELDGVDLLPFLTGARGDRPHEALFWRSGNLCAARAGDLKLVREDGTTRLYDLAADPTERHDLAADRPAEVARLRALYNGWEDGLAEPRWLDASSRQSRWRDAP